MKQQEKIIEIIKNNPKISRAELSKYIGISDSAVKRRLEAMVKNGIVRRIGPNKGGYWEVTK